MLHRIVILSLIITAVHVCTWDGMILHRPAEWLGGVLDFLRVSFFRKPLFECLICMGGVYTLVLDPLLFGWSWWVIADMLAVIGLNTLISAVICRLHE
jgi:hypothetical protein